MTEQEYLEHYGILGMKWGVRRYQNPDGELTALNVAKDFFSVNAKDSAIDKALQTVDVSGVMPGANYISPDAMSATLREINKDLEKANRYL